MKKKVSATEHRLCDWLLFKLIARRLNIVLKENTPLSTLPLKEYSQEAFSSLKIKTVKQAVIAYCLHHDTPGIGQGTWDDLLNVITR